jgi:gamma-glutamyltranspeptidase / glutathione hydrolase
MVQVFLNIFVFGMDPQRAVEAPRFATQSFPNSFSPHHYFPGLLNIEARIPKAVGDRLAEMGNEVKWWDAHSYSAGAVLAIVRDPETGTLAGAADPRRATYALGW